MAYRLTEHVNSGYVDAANRLKPKHAKRRVVAYVESYDDVLFWRSVLEEFESDTLHFEVMLPSRTTLGKGKKLAMANVGALSEALEGTTSRSRSLLQSSGMLGGRHATQGDSPSYMIACVDADYDYLMQGVTPASYTMLNNASVFHTYVYAIENYQCYASGLHSACVMATLNDHELIDFEEFMRQFSLIIWPLLVWSVWCYRADEYKRFSIYDLADVVAIRDINVYHPEQTLEYVRRRANKTIAWLQRSFPQAKKDYEPLREEIRRLGVTPETAYLYIQGHSLFDGVVLQLVGPVCTVLRRERENEIKRLACHETQRQNELSCYQHSVSPIDVMLKKGTAFRQCEPYQRLRADLRRYVDKLNEEGKG